MPKAWLQEFSAEPLWFFSKIDRPEFFPVVSLFKRFRKKTITPDLPDDSRHLTVGRTGEELARRFLELRDFRILVCNYRTRLGEIDIIAEEGDTLVFIEVKTRTGTSHGHPLEAITAGKQRQLVRVALQYLSGETQERPARFDVISVMLGKDRSPQIELVRSAFELPIT
jgi:putative endonuclease